MSAEKNILEESLAQKVTFDSKAQQYRVELPIEKREDAESLVKKANDLVTQGMFIPKHVNAELNEGKFHIFVSKEVQQAQLGVLREGLGELAVKQEAVRASHQQKKDEIQKGREERIGFLKREYDGKLEGNTFTFSVPDDVDGMTVISALTGTNKFNQGIRHADYVKGTGYPNRPQIVISDLDKVPQDKLDALKAKIDELKQNAFASQDKIKKLATTLGLPDDAIKLNERDGRTFELNVPGEMTAPARQQVNRQLKEVLDKIAPHAAQITQDGKFLVNEYRVANDFESRIDLATKGKIAQIKESTEQLVTGFKQAKENSLATQAKEESGITQAREARDAVIAKAPEVLATAGAALGSVMNRFKQVVDSAKQTAASALKADAPKEITGAIQNNVAPAALAAKPALGKSELASAIEAYKKNDSIENSARVTAAFEEVANKADKDKDHRYTLDEHKDFRKSIEAAGVDFDKARAVRDEIRTRSAEALANDKGMLSDKHKEMLLGNIDVNFDRKISGGEIEALVKDLPPAKKELLDNAVAAALANSAKYQVVQTDSNLKSAPSVAGSGKPQSTPTPG